VARPIYLNTLSPVHTGNNVERIGNKVDRDKLSLLQSWTWVGSGMGRVGLGRVGSQNLRLGWVGYSGWVGSSVKISNKYAIYMREIRRL